MHELGIVIHIAKTLDELAEENHLSKIGSVTLQVGEVSGIITDYFEECWNYFKKRHPILIDSVLKLETIHAITFCEDCKQEYDTVRYGRICPFCKSEHTYLVTGNECIIKEIEAEGEDTDEEAITGNEEEDIDEEAIADDAEEDVDEEQAQEEDS